MGFSPSINSETTGALAPEGEQVRPTRQDYEIPGHTYFVTSQTAQRKPFFRHEARTLLLMEVLQSYRTSSYLLHAFVIMPDHFHALISPEDTLERSMQNIKGGFSFRAKRVFAWPGSIWQTGFSDHRIRDTEDWDKHMAYIERNPAKLSLPGRYPYLHTDLDPFPQRLNSLTTASRGGAEAPHLQTVAQLPTSAESSDPPSLSQGIRRPVASTLIIERDKRTNATQK